MTATLRPWSIGKRLLAILRQKSAQAIHYGNTKSLILPKPQIRSLFERNNLVLVPSDQAGGLQQMSPGRNFGRVKAVTQYHFVNNALRGNA